MSMYIYIYIYTCMYILFIYLFICLFIRLLICLLVPKKSSAQTGRRMHLEYAKHGNESKAMTYGCIYI